MEMTERRGHCLLFSLAKLSITCPSLAGTGSWRSQSRTGHLITAFWLGRGCSGACTLHGGSQSLAPGASALPRLCKRRRAAFASSSVRVRGTLWDQN